MLKFEALTDQQIEEQSYFPVGEYGFQVTEAKQHISQNTGNESIKLTLKVFKPDGNFQFLNDYLTVKYIKKIKHFCDAAGLQAQYSSGTLRPEDCVNKSGTVKLKLKNQDTDQYATRNEIDDYIVAATVDPQAPLSPAPATNAADMDDDIPFS